MGREPWKSRKAVWQQWIQQSEAEKKGRCPVHLRKVQCATGGPQAKSVSGMSWLLGMGLLGCSGASSDWLNWQLQGKCSCRFQGKSSWELWSVKAPTVRDLWDAFWGPIVYIIPLPQQVAPTIPVAWLCQVWLSYKYIVLKVDKGDTFLRKIGTILIYTLILLF